MESNKCMEQSVACYLYAMRLFKNTDAASRLRLSLVDPTARRRCLFAPIHRDRIHTSLQLVKHFGSIIYA